MGQPQSIDKVKALPEAEKACKTRKNRLQIHERTQTYVIGFAAYFDDVSKNLDNFFSVHRDSCVCRLCQQSEAVPNGAASVLYRITHSKNAAGGAACSSRLFENEGFGFDENGFE